MPATPLPLALGGFDPLQSAGPALVWTVVLVFVFLECAVIIGLFLPGDSMLLTAGIIFASHETGHTQVWALVVATMLAAIAGNQVGYVIGTRTDEASASNPSRAPFAAAARTRSTSATASGREVGRAHGLSR